MESLLSSACSEISVVTGRGLPSALQAAECTLGRNSFLLTPFRIPFVRIEFKLFADGLLRKLRADAVFGPIVCVPRLSNVIAWSLWRLTLGSVATSDTFRSLNDPSEEGTFVSCGIPVSRGWGL